MDWHAVMLIRALVCLMATIQTLCPASVCYCYATPTPLCCPSDQQRSKDADIFKYVSAALQCIDLGYYYLLSMGPSLIQKLVKQNVDTAKLALHIFNHKSLLRQYLSDN